MASSGQGAYTNYVRPALRAATLIIPRTGERVKRSITLSEEPVESQDDGEAQTNGSGGLQNGHADSRDGEAPNSLTPLLGRRHYSRARRIPARTLSLRLVPLQEKAGSKLKQLKKFWMSRTGQGILKCSLAYLLGSMGTFLPILSDFLGHQDGKHMVATVTVYFHPARSQGNMFEALLCAFIAFIYAAFISVTSMGVTVLFDDVLHLIILGHIIVIVIFLGGGLGMVGWTKQKLSNPLVNVGCSLTSLAIITVVTKEGSIQAGEFSMAKVVQVLKMVVMGCIASTFVCFAIKPVSAHQDLKQSLIEVTDSIGELLSATTRAFLLGSEEELDQSAREGEGQLLSKRSVAMAKHLKESKWEHYVFGRETEYKLEARLVQCIQRLSQNVGGLRSAARSQLDLLAQQTSGYGGNTPDLSKQGHVFWGLQSPPSMENSMMLDFNVASLDAIAETDEEHRQTESHHTMADSGELDDVPTVTSPREIFDRFIDQLGPSVRSLAYSLRQILDELPYGPAPDFPITLHPRFRGSLDEAIELYSHARQDALSSLYRGREMHVSQPRALAADFEEVAASCGYFSYSLLDFAEELRNYLTVVDELQAHEENGLPRSWSWLKFWNFRRKNKSRSQNADDGEPIYIVRTNESGHHDEPADTKINTKPHHWKSTTPNQTAWRRRLWRWAHVMRREDVKFAIKVGFGAAVYALPSFIPATRSFYGRFRGEWGLLSYMLVCSMTIGSANTTGFARGWGTCVGAVASILTWTISQGNAFVLAFFGWIMATITSYITVAKGNGPLGRFIMLTYNLSCLYAYSLSVRDDEDDEDEGGVHPDILEIAFHRVIAVLAGCAWGIIITRLVWPISARNKFHDGLGVLFLRMALIWRRDPLDVYIEGSAPHPYMDLAEEFHMQQYLTQLQGLRKTAAAEYELRGPFPTDEFGRILTSVGRMLEALHSMNTIITKDLRASPGEAEILRFTRDERAYLSTRISHLFQVIASSLRLQFPLNDSLPSTVNARDRLLARIFRFRRDMSRSKDVTDADYALLYAYSLVTMQLSKEIHTVGMELGNLYGVLDDERLKLQ